MPVLKSPRRNEMPKLSQDAKTYLKTLLEYSEGFDGFQTALDETMPDDEEYTRRNTASAEIWALLED
jgi:hypothetical protein